MMDFMLNETQRIFQKSMRDFCKKEVRPLIKKLDEEHLFSYDIYDKLVEMGLPGIIYPEKYGGSGGSGSDMITLSLAMEELARISIGIAMAQGWILYNPPVYY